MKIEFFHDVICSFCYPMSARMRKIKEELPELEIVHRSFALAKSADDLKRMFGSHEAAKQEIMSHWAAANQNDDEHRFNIEGMKNKDFLFPISLPGLRAAKAAGVIGGQDLYWDMFDALQKGLFTENKDISNEDVIFAIAKSVPMDFDAWKEAYESDEVKQKVEEDFALASSYGINGVPNIVINGKYSINGALPYSQLYKALKDLYDEEAKTTVINAGETCSFEDGKINCN